MIRVCVTGGAGFIGSHVVDELLERGHKVRVVDNLLTGRREFLPLFNITPGSIHDPEVLIRAIDGCDWVVHMAANAEGRRGFTRPTWDIQQNILGTSSVLETMRAVGCTNIFYASSGSVYGNTSMPKIPEDCPFPTQTSLYGASKIAGEGLIGAYHEAEGFTGVIGRWMQAIGPRYLHGHVIDFTRRLLKSPHLTILGDGTQAKSGLHVQDLANGIVTTIEAHDSGLHVYNFGSEELVTILESALLIAETLGIEPTIQNQGETWPGDNPHTFLDSSKAYSLGWKAEIPVREAIVETVEYLKGCSYL